MKTIRQKVNLQVECIYCEKMFYLTPNMEDGRQHCKNEDCVDKYEDEHNESIEINYDYEDE